MPEFRIIENFSHFDEETYKKFEKDYMSQDLTVKQLKEKYDFGQNDYKRYIDKVRERTGFIRKGGHMKPSHIYPVGEGKYRVSKWVDGKTVHVGVYKKKDAIQIRNRLIDVHWDLSQLELIKLEVLG